MGRLDTLEAMVREVLKHYPETRDDDRTLTLALWVNVFGVSPWTPVSEAMLNKELPSQESIGRCRRKIQQTDEALRGAKQKEAIRMDAQVDFIEYALSDTQGARI